MRHDSNAAVDLQYSYSLGISGAGLQRVVPSGGVKAARTELRRHRCATVA
jgi:hypothetical protein